MKIKHLGKVIREGEIDDVIALIDEAVGSLNRRGFNVEYALCEYCAVEPCGLHGQPIGECPWCEPGSMVVETVADEQVDVDGWADAIGFCIGHQREAVFNANAQIHYE